MLFKGEPRKEHSIFTKFDQKKLLDVDINSKYDWVLKLTCTIRPYQTTYKVFTRTTFLFFIFLVYRVEAILPIEFEIPSLCIIIDKRLDTS